jgi:hypothetical protein
VLAVAVPWTTLFQWSSQHRKLSIVATTLAGALLFGIAAALLIPSGVNKEVSASEQDSDKPSLTPASPITPAKSNLRGNIENVFRAEYGNGVTFIMLLLSITNTGPPTIVDILPAKIKSGETTFDDWPSDIFEGEMQHNFPTGVVMLKKSELIVEKLATPIITGGREWGYLLYSLPGVSVAQLKKDKLEITIYFQDAEGKTYEAYRSSDDLGDGVNYVPGFKDPIYPFANKRPPAPWLKSGTPMPPSPTPAEPSPSPSGVSQSNDTPIFSVGPTTNYTVQLGSNVIKGDIRDGVKQIIQGSMFFTTMVDDFFMVNSSIENGRLYIDAQIYAGINQPAIELVHNKVIGLPREWDANFDNEAIEIVNKEKQPVFQLEYKDKLYLSIRGYLWTAKGNVVSIDYRRLGNWRRGGPTPAAISLNRLFRYPSTDYSHERDPTPPSSTPNTEASPH